MSKKHFVKLAQAVAQIKDIGERERTAQLLADVCAADNPRFNSSRFYAACGVSGY